MLHYNIIIISLLLPGEEARAAVLSAMDHWMAYTCVKFVPVEPRTKE